MLAVCSIEIEGIEQTALILWSTGARITKEQRSCGFHSIQSKPNAQWATVLANIIPHSQYGLETLFRCHGPHYKHYVSTATARLWKMQPYKSLSGELQDGGAVLAVWQTVPCKPVSCHRKHSGWTSPRRRERVPVRLLNGDITGDEGIWGREGDVSLT